MRRLAPSDMSLASAALGRKAADEDVVRLKAVVDRLVEATDPDAIILFGSRARGDGHEDSDFDLFVLVPETRPFGGKPPFWLWHLVKDFGLSIDVLMRQTALFERRARAANSLEANVSQEGIAVYERAGRS